MSDTQRTEKEILEELLSLTKEMADHARLCEELDGAAERAREAAEKFGSAYQDMQHRRRDLLRELDRLLAVPA